MARNKGRKEVEGFSEGEYFRIISLSLNPSPNNHTVIYQNIYLNESIVFESWR
jgi:hypothetical protein